MSSSDKLDEALLRLSNHQALLGESMNTLTQKIDDLLTRVTPCFRLLLAHTHHPTTCTYTKPQIEARGSTL